MGGESVDGGFKRVESTFCIDASRCFSVSAYVRVNTDFCSCPGGRSDLQRWAWLRLEPLTSSISSGSEDNYATEAVFTDAINTLARRNERLLSSRTIKAMYHAPRVRPLRIACRVIVLLRPDSPVQGSASDGCDRQPGLSHLSGQTANLLLAAP